jgi:hypothetical protein
MASNSHPPTSENQPAPQKASKGVETSSNLPFEPNRSRKKQPKQSAQPAKANNQASKEDDNKRPSQQRAITGVPEEVSKRMARRMAIFCGIPTSLGMVTFVVSYFIVSQHIFKLPTIVVLLLSLGFFGLGVLGLSYGALSASWDEGRVGDRIGWSEFRLNLGRTIASWKEARQKPL